MDDTAETTTPEPAETRVVEDAPPVASPEPSTGPAEDAASAGGASTPTEPAETPGPPADPEPDPRLAELEAERDRLAARVAELEAAGREQSHAAETVALERQAAFDKLSEAAAERDDVLAAWAREKVMAGVLEALGPFQFVSEAAGADFLAAVLPKIQAERRKDGAWVAKGPSGLTVADAVRAEASLRPWLFAASTRGGSGTDGSRPPAPGPQHAPGSFEAIRARYQSQR